MLLRSIAILAMPDESASQQWGPTDPPCQSRAPEPSPLSATRGPLRAWTEEMANLDAATRRNLPQRLRLLSNRSWLELLTASLASRDVAGIRLPGFPPPEVQIQFTGSAGEQTLQEAFAFYAMIREACAKLGRPAAADSRLLDFGVGWGRLLRMFLRDVAEENLYGCDVDADVLALCRTLGMPGNLDRIYPGGKLPYPDAFFDVIVSYSVFTHLPEPVHLHWLAELARVARPGAVFVLTLEPRSFIDDVARLGESGDHPQLWLRQLARFAGTCPQLYEAFDSGQIAYIPTGGGEYRDNAAYGDAIVPLAYVEREWSRYFDVHEYIDDRGRFYQAVLVVQRR